MANFNITPPRLQSFKLLILFIVIIGILSVSLQFVVLITDWFWFQEIGYQS